MHEFMVSTWGPSINYVASVGGGVAPKTIYYIDRPYSIKKTRVNF